MKSPEYHHPCVIRKSSSPSNMFPSSTDTDSVPKDSTERHGEPLDALIYTKFSLTCGRICVLRRATDTGVGPHLCPGGSTVLIPSRRPSDILTPPSQFQPNYGLRSVVVPKHFAYRRAYRPSDRPCTAKPYPQVPPSTTANHRCLRPVISIL